jgi:hypothetical protein
MTDAASGWAVHYPPRNKARKWVIESLKHLSATSPFPLRAIHSDSGSESLNAALVNWRQRHAAAFTRGRTGRKNDNCWVEQNNSTVRKTAGYWRSTRGTREWKPCAPCTAPLDLLTNLFYPCMKLASKERVGAKYRKRCDKAKPPFQRLLEYGKQGRRARPQKRRQFAGTAGFDESGS